VLRLFLCLRCRYMQGYISCECIGYYIHAQRFRCTMLRGSNNSEYIFYAYADDAKRTSLCYGILADIPVSSGCVLNRVLRTSKHLPKVTPYMNIITYTRQVIEYVCTISIFFHIPADIKYIKIKRG
jgi:hypothetical protein